MKVTKNIKTCRPNKEKMTINRLILGTKNQMQLSIIVGNPKIAELDIMIRSFRVVCVCTMGAVKPIRQVEAINIAIAISLSYILLPYRSSDKRSKRTNAAQSCSIIANVS